MKTRNDNLTRRQKRAIDRVQILKSVPVLVVILSLFFYQAEFFNSLQQIQISFDFSNYQTPNNSGILSEVRPTQIPSPPINTQSFTQNNSFSQYIEEFVNYIDQGNSFTTPNITAAEQNVIESQEHFLGEFGTLSPPEFDALSNIGQIEYLLNNTIHAAQQIYHAFLNGSLQEQYLQRFIHDVWRILIDQFLPENWKNPSYIYIENQGRLPIHNLNVTGAFLMNQTNIVFLDFNSTKLEPSGKATLILSVTQIITSFLEITFDALVNKTIQILKEKNYAALELFPEYFRMIIQSIQIEVELLITARLGLLPTSILFRVDLTTMVQKRIMEELSN